MDYNTYCAEKSMVHVCFSLHDPFGRYSKYTGTALCSLMENTSSSLMIHILHDDTLSEDNREKLKEMVGSYRQNLRFYRISTVDIPFDKNLARFTIGAMFRLKLLDVLPSNIKKLIYLDSDIIVNLDIRCLWEIDLEFFLIAGCVSSLPNQHKVLVPEQEYINSGVLLWNIEKIRKENIDMFKESVEFFSRYGMEWAHYADQDAINYIFRGRVLYLDEIYNRSAVLARQIDEMEKNCIYHFFGTVPQDTKYYAPDRLFIKYYAKTPWRPDLLDHYQKRIEEKDREKEGVYCLMKALSTRKKKIIWGIGGQISPLITEFFNLGREDYFLDSNSNFWGKKHNGKFVCNPEKLLEEKKQNIVIIVAVFRYNEVALRLKSMGFVENEHFFNGRNLLSEKSISRFWGDRDQKWDL